MSLEKPSIVRLFDDLAEKIHRQYETIGLDFTVSGGLLGDKVLDSESISLHKRLRLILFNVPMLITVRFLLQRNVDLYF